MRNQTTPSVHRPGGPSLFFRCCYGYLINGMAVLIVGSILPSLIAEAGIGFFAAGAMLSFMAVGNLLASFLFPALVSFLGRRASIAVTSSFVPVSFLLLTFLPPVWVLYLLMLLCGIARGSITIINNSAVSDTSENPAKMLNYLHCSFAVGAFAAPFAFAVFLKLGFNWRIIIYILAFLCATSAFLYAAADYSVLETAAAKRERPEEGAHRREGKEPLSGSRGLRSPDFYLICFLLFFYLGFENCVNGWFVTYLQGTGIVSEAFASSLVSATWIVIMAGRLICAAVSRRISQNLLIVLNCLGSTLFFLMLLLSHSLFPVAAALAGLGFCMAGIYPTCIAAAGPYMKGSTLGMSILTAISSVGGILAPQLIGSLAERSGIVQAMAALLANAGCMLILAVLHMRSSKKEQNNHA